MRTLPLRTGTAIPQLGLGVFRTPPGPETRRIVSEAVACGYRHVDTARIYGNEADVVDGVRDAGVDVNDVFITTKIWNDDQGYDETLRAAEASLARMRLDAVDLLLLHWPVPHRRLQAWRALERLRAEGRARAIGVSNFMVGHLQELLAHANDAPVVNQVELSPFLQHRELRAFCAQHAIVIEAYSPLTKGARLQHPVVRDVARDVGCSPAHVLLAWGLAEGLVVLPKSVRSTRLEENLAAQHVVLSEAQLARLQALEEGLVTGWDPRSAP